MDLIEESKEHRKDLSLSQVLIDSLHQEQGFIVIGGNRYSYLPQTLNLIYRKIGSAKNRRIRIFKSMDDISSVNNCEVVIADGIYDAQKFLQLMHFAESGGLVVFSLMSHSLIGSLHKIFSLFDSVNRHHILWRFADCLQLLIHQVGMEDLQGEPVLAQEIILASPEIKQHLQADNIEALEEVLLTTQEKMGVISLNQALLQYLIRRKIDMKTAFSKTRDPKHLDLLLKNIGL